ncbi:hypothetical protein N431DRAFT_111436 [Stipitochalara longipes BDJ]|nr:hypothetical protein N431DRAFT_111436 [Stipitochalara longipes BDJ]
MWESPASPIIPTSISREIWDNALPALWQTCIPSHADERNVCAYAQKTPPSPLPSTVAIPAGGGLTSGTTVYTMSNVVAAPAPPPTQ